MTAVGRRPRAQQKAASRNRHPASKAPADGRGPRRSTGRRTPTSVALFATTLVLVALGAVMVLSASTAVSIADTDSAWSLFRRQLLWVVLGTTAMFVTMRIDYRVWQVLARPLMVGAGLALLAVALPGVGTTVNGATRWLSIGDFRVQPSEFAKLALVLFIAELLARPSRSMDNPAITVRPIVAVSALVLVLLAAQPHLGAMIIIGAIVAMMLFLGGAPLGHLASVGAVATVLGTIMVWSTPWRRDRLLAFLDPQSDPNDAGYQVLQALGAITEGGWSGLGLGGSYAKYGFLPFAHTDFIFAIIAEELGLIGALGVVLAFVVIGVSGIMTALRAPDRFAMLLAIGITTWVITQAVLNLGAVLSLLPVTGVTLPFLSFGGSSLVVTLAAMGVLVNVARQAN